MLIQIRYPIFYFERFYPEPDPTLSDEFMIDTFLSVLDNLKSMNLLKLSIISVE